ncbi:hypothetical protein FOXB_13115 [Fusarium oxysporum f. sp. conglutinans Fo5176]|uniref:Uncharacterized protein n=1 Tax=Fusarium oxysporum (strain Fo5176) TaxID=660025 RepID=F9G383_FUSOF|nr:hypothetical protein FOXB_13115 [Fusarium oxysporum f. sp. conglutinans Fo5176]
MSAPYDPNNQGVSITLLPARATLPHSLTSRPLHHKKRRATAVYTHVSLHSAAAGSAARPASVVLSASTAAVKPNNIA